MAKDGKRRKSPRWWMDFSDPDGRRRRLPGLTDKRQTAVLAGNVGKLLAVRESGDALPADMLRWLEQVSADFRKRLADAGLIDRDRAGGLAPLMVLDADGKVAGGHLRDFLDDAEARNVSPAQLKLLGQRIRDTLRRAGCVWLRDLSTARTQTAIAALAEPTTARPDGLSRQSQTHYVRAVKQFGAWLLRERRAAENPLAGLRTYNAETDKRHERRGFTVEEMTALLRTTRQAPTRYGMTGSTRAVAYALAFSSGLRRNEIRTLTRASFDLTGDPPTVTVQAGYSKRRRCDVQPLTADVAELLADFLPGADADCPFPLPKHSAEMLHADMADGRAAWIADAADDDERQDRDKAPDFLMPEDSAGLWLDFHSFRHGYVTQICKSDMSPREMLELARHSDPRLTFRRYSRVAVADTARALEAALPKLNTGPGAERQAGELRATGTDDAVAGDDGEKRFARFFAKQGELSGRYDELSRTQEQRGRAKKNLASAGKTRISKGQGDSRRGAGVADRAGFENR